MHINWERGDWVVYRKPKRSTSPGPRASNIRPAREGDDYSYEVDKFWVVAETRPDGNMVLMTRTGKTHVVSRNDPRLRRPYIWQRLLYAQRFPAL
jgi:hypothetical protein